ncbi:MAG: TonB family protein [Puniceicoccaceae bacterium]|nr:MAG: TonB family protein [Puniceicoccaceae bacterium]
MHRLLVCFSIFLGAVLLDPVAKAATSTSPADLPPEFTPAEILKTTPVNYPYTMSARGREGVARVLVSIDEAGRALDAVPVDASHRDFGEALARSVRKWSFQPARWQDEAIRSRLVVSAELRLGRSIVILTRTDFTSNRIDGMTSPRDQFRVVRADELDQPLRARHTVAPGIPEEWEAEAAELVGTVMLDFVIDPNGNVRVPGVRSADDPRLAALALGVIEDWKFDPPVRGGRPVYVHVAQPFVFDP